METGSFEAVISHNRDTLLHRAPWRCSTWPPEPAWQCFNAAPYASGLLAKGPAAYPPYAYQDAPADVLERARRMAEVCSDYGVPLAAAREIGLRRHGPPSIKDVARLSGPPSLWMMSGGTASACRATRCRGGVNALAGSVTRASQATGLG